MGKGYHSRLIGEGYHCPSCDSTMLKLDERREEIYCGRCGLVISSSSSEGILPWDYGEQVATPSGTATDITNYRHTYTNRQLMKHGLRRR